ncbi:oligosaccharide flippase family protein [Pseudomonas sp. SK2]|uniref:oligosaccharide flippase family protein n=1 Tax=Pseudomonas sp. SK2 TaxID=2841063 RepID=UPI00192C2F48|nr:oligosaccharide flippase family protein [Pseudomonas sp. SK2]QQZ37591.1 oligosaccharide flippase family protein [Pseudomonas sp. SK2]
MALKQNIVANYISQIYVAAIGILILPLYVKYMGAEAYGLIGFFAMLQAWFALLDLGLTPTISREAARYNGGAISALDFRRLFRALTTVFVVIAVLGGGLLWLVAEKIAMGWLNINQLDPNTVVLSIKIMVVCVSLRWMGGVYRGVISGSERLVWLSIFNMVIASLRFFAVFISLYVFGFSPVVFFFHQLFVAVVEMVGLLLMATKLLPRPAEGVLILNWSFRPVLPLLKFSLSIAFTSSVWVLMTQTDKLILSGILPLADYGYFSLAVLVAGGIMIISGPISTALLPRMARLYAQEEHQQLLSLYRMATQSVAVLAGAASVTIFYCAKPLLMAWTADAELSSNAAPILSLYALGNGILAIGAFPYYLQYARGQLKYHLIGSVGMVLVLLPAIIIAVKNFGTVGAGYVWLSVNAIYVLIWVAFVHGRLEPGLHLNWLFNDCLKIFAAPALLLAPLAWFPLDFENRLQLIGFLFVVSALALLSAILSASQIRQMVVARFKRVIIDG